MRVTLRSLVPLGLLVVASCGSTVESNPITTAPSTTALPTTVPDTTMPSTTQPATSAPTTATVPVATERAGVYLVRDQVLTVVGRDIAVDTGAAAETPALASAALHALLAGPSADEAMAGIVSLVPAGTELNGVDVQGSVATVDLSSEFESGGGTLSMTLRIAQVVYTATAIDGIDMLRFRIDGEPRTTIGGEGVMVDGVGREQFTDGVLPAILLETPFDGDAYVDPLRITGTTNVFEATFNYQVVAADGTLLLEGFAMASCGTGCWGVFDAVLPALPAGASGPFTLRVFDISEADGVTLLDLVEITLV